MKGQRHHGFAVYSFGIQHQLLFALALLVMAVIARLGTIPRINGSGDKMIAAINAHFVY